MLNIGSGMVGKACEQPHNLFAEAVEITGTRLHVNIQFMHHLKQCEMYASHQQKTKIIADI